MKTDWQKMLAASRHQCRLKIIFAFCPFNTGKIMNLRNSRAQLNEVGTMGWSRDSWHARAKLKQNHEG